MFVFRFFLFFVVFSWGAAQAAPRIGAARALRVVTQNGSPLEGALSQPSWSVLGGQTTLFFTREADGTRNIWRAVPDNSPTARFPIWRATPVTTLRRRFLPTNRWRFRAAKVC